MLLLHKTLAPQEPQNLASVDRWSHSPLLSSFLAIYKYLLPKPIIKYRVLPLEMRTQFRQLSGIQSYILGDVATKVFLQLRRQGAVDLPASDSASAASASRPVRSRPRRSPV